MSPAAKKKLGRRARTLATVVALTTMVLVAVGAYLHAAYHAEPDRRFASAGPNAAWAGHVWVGEGRPEAAYDRLAATLKRHRITDVFFHVGPLDGAGRIPAARAPYARDLVTAMRSRYPELRLQAWMGQVEKAGGGPLDLSDAGVRATIVQTATRFLDLGFDGIHFNFEPLASGNSHLLALLEAAHAVTRARGAVLSMATYELEPVPGLAWLVDMFADRGGFWTADYYRAVAARADQLAVMMYDTALPREWLYGNLVAWETKSLRRILGERTTLFIGVPSHEDHGVDIDPSAETMGAALRGVQLGLNRAEVPPGAQFGVAIYALWTTDTAAWSRFQQGWLSE